VNARLQPHDRWQAQSPNLRSMQVQDLDRVLAVEKLAYSFPWTRGNFIDSLAAGYTAELLVDPHDELIGYLVAMTGVDEVHLLNLTVAPPWQGLGHAATLLDVLEAHARAVGATTLWLEVRDSNERARHVYRRRGFAEVGVRPRYYPAGYGRREDAIVMSLQLPQTAT
jgi:[ribosomal protein S18]-alanine N-acetyltransferase